MSRLAATNVHPASSLRAPLTTTQIDERIIVLHQHIREWHAGHEMATVTPQQCRDRIDQLLTDRYALVEERYRADRGEMLHAEDRASRHEWGAAG